MILNLNRPFGSSDPDTNLLVGFTVKLVHFDMAVFQIFSLARTADQERSRRDTNF